MAQGQKNVEIRGTTANAAGKTFALYGYTDMLTQNELLLDEAVADSTGAFSLGCYINYPRLVFVQAENYSQSFFIEPGRTYEVYLPTFDWDIDEQKNVFLDPVALPFLFQNLPSDELNLQIKAFDELVDSFLFVNRLRMDFRFRPERKLLDTLAAEVRARFGEGDETFFQRYMRYRLAQMRAATHLEKRERVVERYITDGPVRYYDENYMQLFFDLFAHTVSGGTRKVGQHRLVEWVAAGDYGRYMDSLGLDPLLRNEQIRELAALEALKESFYDRHYSRQGVARMVTRMKQESKFDEHRRLAQNLLESFSKAEAGAELPHFELPDVDRTMVSLDDFRGKWVYLSFVRVGDPNSLRELETMAHFRDSVYSKHPDVVFVTVSCDREFQKMFHLLKNSRKGARYNWTWLHFDGNYRLLERYGVVSYPTFMLLDPQGQLYYDYTPAPASGILLHGPWEKQDEEKEAGGAYRFR
jgi:peroxiredoxin